jgi:hypothetical protein
VRSMRARRSSAPCGALGFGGMAKERRRLCCVRVVRKWTGNFWRGCVKAAGV